MQRAFLFFVSIRIYIFAVRDLQGLAFFLKVAQLLAQLLTTTVKLSTFCDTYISQDLCQTVHIPCWCHAKVPTCVIWTQNGQLRDRALPTPWVKERLCDRDSYFIINWFTNLCNCFFELIHISPNQESIKKLENL